MAVSRSLDNAPWQSPLSLIAYMQQTPEQYDGLHDGGPGADALIHAIFLGSWHLMAVRVALSGPCGCKIAFELQRGHHIWEVPIPVGAELRWIENLKAA